MTALKVTNNAITTLASGINSAVTSLDVAGGAGALFPTLGAGEYFWATLTNTGGAIERVKVTARSTDTFTIVRGQDNSSAQSWLTGDKVELRLTAAAIDLFPKTNQANVFTQPQAMGTGVGATDAVIVSQWQAGTGIAYQTTGTSTAYVLTPVPAISSYAANTSFFITFHVASGATPTLAVSGLASPPNLVRQLPDGTFANIAAGEIPINHRSCVTLLSATQAWVEEVLPGSELNAATAKTTLTGADLVGIADSAASYVYKKITWTNLQGQITVLGTIATGVWQGTVVAGQYGGTGVANTGKTITLGGNLTTSGAYASTFTMSGAYTYTFPGQTDTLAALAATQTLTNKRVTPRVLSAASYTTDTGSSLNCDTLDEFIVTAQAGALKFNNPSGTPTDGQCLIIAVTGTAARALTYDTQFEASTVALPTTTVTTARLTMGFLWRADTSKWVIVGAA